MIESFSAAPAAAYASEIAARNQPHMTLRYKLRTLLILLAILPPLLWLGWTKHEAYEAYEAWRNERAKELSVLWSDEHSRFNLVHPPVRVPDNPAKPAEPPQPRPKAPAKAGE